MTVYRALFLMLNLAKNKTITRSKTDRQGQVTSFVLENIEHNYVFQQEAPLWDSSRSINGLLWAPAQRKRATMLYFANVFFYLFLWPPYSPALVNGGSRKFYTWWTLSVNREVSSWIFSWSPLNNRVGQKVTKFGVFSDSTRKLSALTPERGRIL